MDLDEVDTTFVDSLVPDGAMATGLYAIVTWLDADGEPRFRCYNQTDERLSGLIGLLEMAKKHVFESCEDD